MRMFFIGSNSVISNKTKSECSLLVCTLSHSFFYSGGLDSMG